MSDEKPKALDVAAIRARMPQPGWSARSPMRFAADLTALCDEVERLAERCEKAEARLAAVDVKRCQLCGAECPWRGNDYEAHECTKKWCEACDASGQQDTERGGTWVRCSDCDGTGRVPK